MPTYSLRCSKCNHEWTDFMSISEKENAKCPKCGGKAETLFGKSEGTVLIKGSGFYQESKLR